jgi:hypothetical protein
VIWTPIIEADLVEPALAAITSAMLASAETRLDIPLFLAYRGLPDAAVDRLNRLIRTADALYSQRRFGLFDGLAGLGWVTEHLARMLGFDSSGLNADTDAALLGELERGAWRGSLDWPDGLAGFGVYFRERLPAPPAQHGLKLVEAHLAGRIAARPQMEGAVWRAHELNRAWQTGEQTDSRGHALQFLETALIAPLAENGILSGPAGTGLVLLAASSPAEPKWDRLIGLS